MKSGIAAGGVERAGALAPPRFRGGLQKVLGFPRGDGREGRVVAVPQAEGVSRVELEKWIQIETAKIIRDRLRWCYRIEGVNHHQKCRHLVDQYLESTRGVGWGKDHRPADLHEPKKVVEVEE